VASQLAAGRALRHQLREGWTLSCRADDDAVVGRIVELHPTSVEVELADGPAITGRLGSTEGGVVDLVVRAAGNWTIRRIPLTEIRRAAVQVEFSRPSARELELAGTHETEAEA
jgi:hypothetical protein